MSSSTLSHAATAVLQTVVQGYRHGFDVIGVTGLPSGTVYPALRRLEESGFLKSAWEDVKLAQDAQRPPRRVLRGHGRWPDGACGGAGPLSTAGEVGAGPEAADVAELSACLGRVLLAISG